VSGWGFLPGETPIDVSGLKRKGINSRAELNRAEAAIHPFRNGNGRWARMLANIWLKRHTHGITEWPEETIGSRSVIRDEYLAAIRAADEGDEGPLRDLHQRLTTIPSS